MSILVFGLLFMSTGCRSVHTVTTLDDPDLAYLHDLAQRKHATVQTVNGDSFRARILQIGADSTKLTEPRVIGGRMMSGTHLRAIPTVNLKAIQFKRRGRGALIGAGLGAATGAGLYVASVGEEDFLFPFSLVLFAAVPSATGALVGSLFGTRTVFGFQLK